MEKTSLSEKFQFLALGFFMATTSFLAFNAAAAPAWQGPTANPPGNNATPPINESGNLQDKAGELTLGGTKICLEDGTNCPNNGTDPSVETSINRMLGAPDAQNLAITLSSGNGASGTVNNADKLDGLHAADLQAQSANSGESFIAAFYTRSVLGEGWECLPYSSIARGDDHSIVSMSNDGKALIGGAYHSEGRTTYVTSHSSHQANFLCIKVFK